MPDLTVLIWLGIGVALLLVLAFLINTFHTYKHFSRELHRLNTEIKRTYGIERRRFKRRRRRLWFAWLTMRYH